MFDSIYTATITPIQFFTMVGTTLAAGVIYAWMMSFAIRSSKRFFLVYEDNIFMLTFLVHQLII